MTTIINANEIKNLYEIELNALPNFEFSVSVGGFSWDFKFKTDIDESTKLSIFKDNVCVCWQAPISIFMHNLLYCSDFTDGVFFFTATEKLQSPSYKDLGEKIRLYYADI